MKNIKGPSVFTGESFSRLINATAEMDRIVNEIAVIAKVAPDEVYEFYKSHQYSLELIKQAVLLCGTLDKDAMENAIVKQTTSIFFANIELAIKSISSKSTWKDKLANVPYFIGYYAALPFIWFFGRIWDGISDAWVDMRGR
jgi:hypothetical protein